MKLKKAQTFIYCTFQTMLMWFSVLRALEFFYVDSLEQEMQHQCLCKHSFISKLRKKSRQDILIRKQESLPDFETASKWIIVGRMPVCWR